MNKTQQIILMRLMCAGLSNDQIAAIADWNEDEMKWLRHALQTNQSAIVAWEVADALCRHRRKNERDE